MDGKYPFDQISACRIVNSLWIFDGDFLKKEIAPRIVFTGTRSLTKSSNKTLGNCSLIYDNGILGVKISLL